MELSRYPVCIECKRPLVPYETEHLGLVPATAADAQGRISGTFVCHSALCSSCDLIVRVGA